MRFQAACTGLNYLAHIYLSATPDIMIGNFIADFVKGKSKNNYEDAIRSGIELHRAIDDFTDHHPVTSLSKHRLYPTQHKYAPVVVDMFYDHFLAKNFDEFSTTPLSVFAANAYEILLKNESLLPAKVRHFLPYMIQHNWLLSYATIEGIGRTLRGLSKRVAFKNQMHTAENDLVLGYSNFEKEFRDFFPELITFAAAKS
jgi:acyl carrier protein phosphodiesterase